MATRKREARKTIAEKVNADLADWVIRYGELKRGKGRRARINHLFTVVAEKLPYPALTAIKKHFTAKKHTPKGVYIAHDSMGCPRYIGRGWIFNRLETRKKVNPHELKYFSFYVVAETKHQREIETLLIRTAGFLLEFNSRKKRVGLGSGNIRDYEAGTFFYERQRKRKND